MMESEQRARALLPRHTDLTALFDAVRDMHCVSVVGVSNLGKSALLRSMTDPEIQARYLGHEATNYVFIYVDYNQMLEMTGQAFYELWLRCSLDALHRHKADDEVARRVEAAYTALVAPASSLEIPLSFAQAMTAIGSMLPQRVVFLLDEIDGPIAEIDGRVFLNLRALKDKHRQGLTYVTATNRRLGQIRPASTSNISGDADVAEFGELFAHHRHFISPLNDGEIADYVAQFAKAENVTFSPDDLAFVRLWAGGHPSLLETTCRVLGILTGRPVRDSSQDWIIHRRATEILSHDINIQIECRKMWNDLTAPEQEALLALFQPNEEPDPAEIASVTAKHLLVGIGPERRIFCRAFAEFAQRQHIARRPYHPGLQVDPESGEVRVEGVQVPTLTNLEYRLLLLLYGRLGKICSKYEVVEAVWGEDYIDEIDDARIEKLISRVRQKIEPDIANPRYLITVRGRGYKLLER
jgi:hypothetical protein